MKIVARLTAVCLLAALAACNTVQGMGKDVQTGGAAITDSAKDVESSL